MIKPHALFTVTTPDAVAECVSIPTDLYGKLWELVEFYPTDTREFETPPEPDVNCLASPALWGRLSEDDQKRLNDAATAHEAELARIINSVR